MLFFNVLLASFLTGGSSALVQAAESKKQLNQTVSANCHKACAQLSTTFGSAFHYPNNDNFTIWDAKQQEVRPACRVEPSSANQVSDVLSILVDNWCHFAVKGGGHSRHPDDSNSVAGVTVDLDRISSVKVSADGTRARVGGGANTVQVYQALDRHNLSFVGGRVGTVGIGGFTLGGGTSPFANRYGLALDNVYEYEVVLANGSITTASENYNPDLYFALRGGGNNFGIVTSFTFRIFPQGRVSNTMTTYSNEYNEQVLDRVNELWTDEELSKDVDMAYDFRYSYSPDTDNFTMAGTQRYARPVANPTVFKAINQIPTLTRATTIDTMSNMMDSTEALGTTRHLFATLSVLPSRALLSRGIEIFTQEVEAIKTVEGLTPNFISYPLQRNAIAAMRQRGGNSLGIDQDEPLFLILISTAWSNAADDAAVNKMTDNIIRRLRSAAEALGVAHRYLYINYASEEQTKEIFPGYGEENFQKLQEIQKEVDPVGIFTSKGLWRGYRKLV